MYIKFTVSTVLSIYAYTNIIYYYLSFGNQLHFILKFTTQKFLHIYTLYLVYYPSEVSFIYQSSVIYYI